MKLDPSSAVTMVYFGDYLLIKELKDCAQEFIRKLLRKPTSNELLVLLRDANRLHQKDLKDAVVHSTAQRPDVMKENTVLSKLSDIELWCSVWKARKHYPNETVASTKQWSENVANFMHRHRSIVDFKTFGMLTDAGSLPIISPDAAVRLMEQEQEFLTEKIDEDAVTTLTCLQKRCITSLYERETGIWKVSKKDNENLKKLHKRLKELPSVVSDSLFVSMMEFKAVKTLSLEVSGAERVCINGIYKSSGMHKHKPVFTRYGIFDDGSRQQFIIHSKDDGYFYISVVPEGEELGSSGSNVSDLYRTYTKHQNPMAQTSGWNKCSSGLDDLVNDLEFLSQNLGLSSAFVSRLVFL